MSLFMDKDGKQLSEITNTHSARQVKPRNKAKKKNNNTARGWKTVRKMHACFLEIYGILDNWCFELKIKWWKKTHYEEKNAKKTLQTPNYHLLRAALQLQLCRRSTDQCGSDVTLWRPLLVSGTIWGLSRSWSRRAWLLFTLRRC